MKRGAKRFYINVERTLYSPFEILLDGRPVKTPGGQKLNTGRARELADAIADEWRSQGESILPETMPLTKLVNTAIDRVPSNRDAIVDELAKYANTDLLCYRAEAPVELVHRQQAWDKWLAWAAEEYWARLDVITGVTHKEQPKDAIERIRDAIAAHDDFKLTALHVGITITGSAVLGLAFAARQLSAAATFELSQIDETYQAERWGRDAEAEKARAARLAELIAAERLLKLIA